MSDSARQDAVRQALADILASPQFRTAPRLSSFLRLVVELKLEGRADEIKEYRIATEVYERPADFDPKVDSIVRVEAHRLRSRLQEYYDGPGATATVRMEIPRGGYVPVFVMSSEPNAPPAPAATAPGRSRRFWLGAMATGSAAALGAWVLARRRPEPDVFLYIGGAAGGATDTAGQFRTRLALAIGRKSGRYQLREQSDPRQFHLSSAGEAPAYAIVLTGNGLNPKDYTVLAEAGAPASERATLGVLADGASLEPPEAFAERLARALKEAEAEDRRLPQEARALYAQALTLFAESADSLLLTTREAEANWPLSEILAGLRRLDRATQLAPGYAAAYAQIAWLSRLAANYDSRFFDQGWEAAKRSVDLDDRVWKGHFNLGYLAFFEEWNFQEAAQRFAKAVTLAPARLEIIRYYADALAITGRAAQARQRLERLLAVAPQNALVGCTAAALAYHGGDFREMLRLTGHVLSYAPNHRTAQWQQALAFEQLEDLDAARRTLEPLVTAEPGDRRPAAALAHVLYRMGHNRQAQAVAEAAKLEASAYLRGLLAAARGKTSEALTEFERAQERREIALAWFAVDPRLKAPRETPRGAAILTRMGLPRS